MIGTIMGIGAIAGKAIANNNAKNEQKKENRELMKYQADLNQQQAYYSTGLAKDLWDYTNYENTIRHIKAAGLSPSLIYGGGGGGGSTSGGGQASGVGMPSKTGTEAGIQAQGMALQLAAPVPRFPKAPIHLWKVSTMSRPGKVLRVAST